MSDPFVTFNYRAPNAQIRITNIEEEVLEWSEDFMTPLETRKIGRATVKIDGEEIYFFAIQRACGIWHCRRQCEDASEFAEALSNMGIIAHIIR